MKNLFEAGFEAGVWFETIVSTYCENKEPHAAAMGCMTHDGSTIILKPFINTNTYRNLVRHQSLVVNLCHDPAVFFKVVFEEPLSYEEAEKVNAPRLLEAYAWVEAVLSELIQNDGPRAEALCKVVLIYGQLERAKPYSRAEHVLMEALIHYTRIKAFAKTEKHDEAVALCERIKYYEGLLNRVSSKSSHLSMMRRIMSESRKLVEGT